MPNSEIARIFEELANLLEVDGANAFRVRAYRNAARTVSSLAEPIAELAAQGTTALTELPGIGADLAKKIVTICDTGELPQLNELREKLPADVNKMLRLPGLGPKKIAGLIDALGINTIDDLRKAAEEGRIASLKGFAKKTEQTILEHIDDVVDIEMRFHLNKAKHDAELILEHLRQSKAVTRAEAAGSLRRWKESVGDLDILAISSDHNAAMDALAAHELVERVLQRGGTKQRVRLRSGLELDLRVVPERSFGAAMQYFTGSKEHNIVLRRRAQDRGWKLNEYGLVEEETDEVIAGTSEEEIYKALELEWIPPELRENRGEIELAEKGPLPSLISASDIRGDLHMHTTATDGRATIEEMALAARARGLSYIAITDHSPRVAMAGGLDPEKLRAHWSDIREVNQRFDDLEILCGIECDIIEDATLDLPDDVLAEADWVLAVLHYGLQQPKDQIMKRLLTAVKNPNVHAIGHPTGRILLSRNGAAIEWNELYAACAEHGVMLEINCSPTRLDIDDVHAAAAKEHGIPIVINTDAHSTNGLATMEYGVSVARRAGLTAQDIANTRELSAFRKLCRR